MKPVQKIDPYRSNFEALNLYQQFRVKPGQKVNLQQIDPANTCGIEKEDIADARTEYNLKRIRKLQEILMAEKKYAVLATFDGMDTSGKDGVTKNTMGALIPQGIQVCSFKEPTPEELAHDYLWRIHNKVPPKGVIGTFIRSQYEDVVTVRVKKLVHESVWKSRFEQINDFEKMLRENGVVILKFFLHISKKENRTRLLKRLEQPDKTYKFNIRDLETRKLWDEFMKAYGDALTKCSTDWSPSFVIPSDHKWFRDMAVSEIMFEVLKNLEMDFPKSNFDPKEVEIE
jgi:PPK2 family polyphosphate:nucleotide phosphotransferase